MVWECRRGVEVYDVSRGMWARFVGSIGGDVSVCRGMVAVGVLVLLTTKIYRYTIGSGWNVLLADI